MPGEFLLKLVWGQIIQCRMHALGIVNIIDEVRQSCNDIGKRFVAVEIHFLNFQGVRCEILLMPQLAVETGHDSEIVIGSRLNLRLGMRC